jgi:CarD family transcriptional regulator
MRPVMSRDEAEALIDAIPGIEPAICQDNRFNHVDAFYKELFKQHSCEALVAIMKGLRCRMSNRKSKSSRAEATLKHAKEILHGELSVALDIDYKDVERYISERLGPDA